VAAGDRSPAPAAPAGGFDLRALLDRSGAVRRGHFLLSSGFHSATYVQCALLFEDPRRARQVGGALAARLEPFRPASILSPALGGVVLGHEVAAALGVPFRFAERSGEAMALRRGFALAPGERVAIVEDVVTTGRSTREVAAVTQAGGAEAVVVGAAIDRTGGQASRLGLPFEALLRLDFETWPADDCPLCREGGVAQKPGSRPG
jgi:orotate phosphoribosyltransferase